MGRPPVPVRHPARSWAVTSRPPARWYRPVPLPCRAHPLSAPRRTHPAARLVRRRRPGPAPRLGLDVAWPDGHGLRLPQRPESVSPDPVERLVRLWPGPRHRPDRERLVLRLRPAALGGHLQGGGATVTSLAEPLARAMASRGATFYSPVPEQGTDVDAILAALRNDPATLAALAEALHADCVFEWNRRWATGARHITQHGVDAMTSRPRASPTPSSVPSHDRRARRHPGTLRRRRRRAACAQRHDARPAHDRASSSPPRPGRGRGGATACRASPPLDIAPRPWLTAARWPRDLDAASAGLRLSGPRRIADGADSCAVTLRARGRRQGGGRMTSRRPRP